MIKLNTIAEIKQAVDNGDKVYCGNDLYQVIKDSIGQYLILCASTNYCIGLHGMKGTKHENALNGENFYTRNSL